MVQVQGGFGPRKCDKVRVNECNLSCYNAQFRLRFFSAIHLTSYTNVFRVRGCFLVLENLCHHNNNIIECVSHLHAMFSLLLCMPCIRTLYDRPICKSSQWVDYFLSDLYLFSMCIFFGIKFFSMCSYISPHYGCFFSIRNPSLNM